VGVEPLEELALLADDGVPDSGGQFVDQVGVGGTPAEHRPDGGNERPVALGIEVFPGGGITGEGPVDELAVGLGRSRG
jgi:hypothetical protein